MELLPVTKLFNNTTALWVLGKAHHPHVSDKKPTEPLNCLTLSSVHVEIIPLNFHLGRKNIGSCHIYIVCPKFMKGRVPRFTCKSLLWNS